MANGWSIDPSVFMNQVEEDVGKKLRFISLQLLNEIVSRSPVDTGRFRANNQVSIGSPEYGTTDTTDKNGSATLQQGSAVIAQENLIQSSTFRITSHTRNLWKMVTRSRLRRVSTLSHSTV